MTGGLTFGAARPALSRVVENGTCDDDPRVLSRLNEATHIALNLRDPSTGATVIPVGAMATYDITADGTELLLPPELENAIEVEVLDDGRVNRQRDVRQGFYDLVNPATYVDPLYANDNPLQDLFLHPDPDDSTVLRRKYNYPGLSANATVRVTGKKRYRPITSDDDYLIVQNLRALKLIIQGVEREENGNMAESDALFARATEALLAEIKGHQLDPLNSMKRKAAYDADLVNFSEGTFGYTRARLAFEVPGALSQGKSELTRLLEQAEMRLMDKGMWVGAIEEFEAQVVAGRILCPTRVKTILGATLCGNPLDIRSIFFKYQSNGPGMNHCASILHDEGEVYFKANGTKRRMYRLGGSTNERISDGPDSITLSPGTTTIYKALYIGTDNRFVPVEGGGIALEIKQNGVWVRQWIQSEL